MTTIGGYLLSDIAFAGRSWDEEAGLYWWYEPDTGRFIGEDPAQDGSNWYTYAGNDPVNFRDPTGLTQAGNPLNNLYDLTSTSFGTSSYSDPTNLIGSSYGPVDTGSFNPVHTYDPFSNDSAVFSQIANALPVDTRSPSARYGSVPAPTFVERALGYTVDIGKGVASGLKTGLKATANSVASAATLGFVNEAFTVNDYDRAIGYDYSRITTGLSAELGVGFLAGSVKTASYAGRALYAFDVAQNTVDVGHGAIDVYQQGGLTVSNSLQLFGGLAGGAGDYAGATRVAPKTGPRTGPHGVNPAHHNANIAVRDANGNLIRHQRLVSGSMTEAEKALGFPKNTLASHTEARAVTHTPLTNGQTMKITGQRPPCPSCKGYMNSAASESGASILYRWRENGVTQIWRANGG